MNEPYRLRDLSENGLERALLDAGASYRSSDAARAKTLAALGLAGSAAVSIGVASLASSSWFGKLGWTKLLAISGLSAAAAVPVGMYGWQRLHVSTAPPALVAPAVVAVERRPAAPASKAETPPAPIAPVEEPAPAEVEVSTTPPAPRADARSVSQSALAAELAALERARSRLAAGDPTGALSQLDDYSRAYPRGRMALEAEVLRIDALAKNGQKGAAARRAETFLKRHPNSVLASRVRGYLPE